MAKKFFPERWKLVDASPPHPANTRYKVSVGLERLGHGYVPVVKVQMVYGDEIAGPTSPSYPVGTDDIERVEQAIREVLHPRYGDVTMEGGQP